MKIKLSLSILIFILMLFDANANPLGFSFRHKLDKGPLENSRFSAAGLLLGTTNPAYKKNSQVFLNEITRRTQIDPDSKEGWTWINSDLEGTQPFIWLIIGPGAKIDKDIIVRLQRFMAMGGTVLCEAEENTLAKIKSEDLKKKLFLDKKFRQMNKKELLSRTFYILPEQKSAKFNIMTLSGRAVWIESTTPLLKHISEKNFGTQREHSIRAAINIVAYTLTGSYKDDLTHVKFLLRRKKK